MKRSLGDIVGTKLAFTFSERLEGLDGRESPEIIAIRFSDPDAGGFLRICGNGSGDGFVFSNTREPLLELGEFGKVRKYKLPWESTQNRENVYITNAVVCDGDRLIIFILSDGSKWRLSNDGDMISLMQVL